jgi:4-amino-4-deoxy-L-arabinose transferase-like glycosyltransferase
MRGQGCRLGRSEWTRAALFFAVALILYAPFRTRLAYLWDSVEFVLAIRDYNVTLSQPHAPGYFLYVMLGRLVNYFVGDPHASLVWMSVVGGAGLVAVIFLLGTTMFGERVGVAAALVTLTSPMVWFYSDVALTYAVDAFLVTMMVLVCWEARQTGVGWAFVVGMGVLLALIGGVRQQSVPGLWVLLGITLWSAPERRAAKIFVAVSLWLLLTILWVSVMLHMTGGWDAYWQPLHRISHFHAHKTLLKGGQDAVIWNVFFAGLYCFDGLLLGMVILMAGLALYCFGLTPERKKSMLEADGLGWRTIAAWIVPIFLLATMVGYTEAHGHVFTYLPGLFLLTGYVMGRIDNSRLGACLVAMVCTVNVLVFLAWPTGWDGVLWGTARTARELRTHDERLEKSVTAIRQRYNPQETVVCHIHGDLFFGLRHFQLYLPEFRQIRLDPDLAMVNPPSRPVMGAMGGKTIFTAQADVTKYQTAILVAPGSLPIDSFHEYFDLAAMKRIEDGGIDLYSVPTASFRKLDDGNQGGRGCTNCPPHPKSDQE